jgi:hypothetical protein
LMPCWLCCCSCSICNGHLTLLWNDITDKTYELNSCQLLQCIWEIRQSLLNYSDRNVLLNIYFLAPHSISFLPVQSFIPLFLLFEYYVYSFPNMLPLNVLVYFPSLQFLSSNCCFTIFFLSLFSFMSSFLHFIFHLPSNFSLVPCLYAIPSW